MLENIKTATFVISSDTYPAVRNVRMQKKLLQIKLMKTENFIGTGRAQKNNF